MPDAVLLEVRRAVLGGRKLRIHYESFEQEPRWSTVDPIGLVTVREKGYLLATESGTDRTFRLSRMLSAEALDEPAQRPDRVDLGALWQERSTQFRAGGDQLAVLVRLNPARREELVTTALAVLTEEPEPDGWLRISATFQDARHAQWAVWQLGTDGEALAPESLRAALRERAAVLVSRYE